jgi:hypothetical protein
MELCEPLPIQIVQSEVRPTSLQFPAFARRTTCRKALQRCDRHSAELHRMYYNILIMHVIFALACMLLSVDAETQLLAAKAVQQVVGTATTLPGDKHETQKATGYTRRGGAHGHGGRGPSRHSGG